MLRLLRFAGFRETVITRIVTGAEIAVSAAAEEGGQQLQHDPDQQEPCQKARAAAGTVGPLILGLPILIAILLLVPSVGIVIILLPLLIPVLILRAPESGKGIKIVICVSCLRVLLAVCLLRGLPLLILLILAV